jgi:hypothetical protein
MISIATLDHIILLCRLCTFNQPEHGARKIGATALSVVHLTMSEPTQRQTVLAGVAPKVTNFVRIESTLQTYEVM